MAFLWNVAASLLASLLFVTVAGALSKTARGLLITLLGRLLDIDVEAVFRNPREAARDIERELDRSRSVAVLTGRGGELQRETFARLLREAAAGRRRIRILLPRSARPGTGIDWTDDREREVASFDPAFGAGILREQIEVTVRYLGPFVAAGAVELRLFDYPHVGRVLLTDRTAYFTPYRADAHARDSRVIKYRCGGDMHDHLQRLFDKLWLSAVPAGEQSDVRDRQ
jgi:hypothetical protein